MVGMGCENDPLELRSAQQRGDRSVAEAFVTMNLGGEGKAIAQPPSRGSRRAMAARRSGATDQ